MGVRRSVTGRRWVAPAYDERLALALAQRLGLPEFVARFLAARGVALEDAAAFLDPTLRHSLPDPSSLQDMDRAAARLAEAITTGEAVLVFGDYDVDGATAAALLVRFFAASGGRIEFYVPDRLREGYGPNREALLRYAASGVRLVVTVDCGTHAFAAIEAAAQAGQQVIVADHHAAEARLPAAYAVVNPNRHDGDGRYGELAAVGVAFLLVVAINRALRRAGWYAARREPDLRQWLDLVALGTVCDVVPLVGVNRALTRQGLAVLGQGHNVGLRVLSEVAAVRGVPDVFTLGFLLGPRINAGGRVGQADLGVRLLTTDDPALARVIAERLDRFNAERRAIEGMVLDAATPLAERSVARGESLVVVSGQGWHPGVIGIVAGRLRERFDRPAVVIALDGETGRGSGRSVPGVNLGEAVSAARQAGLVLDGGGHRMAAGLTVAAERVPALAAFLAQRVALADAAGTEATLAVDGVLAAMAAVQPDVCGWVARAGPFGAGNEEPVFALSALRVVHAEVVGGDHVRCILAGRDGARLPAIAFRAATDSIGRELLAARGSERHVAGYLRRGRRDGAAELHIRDIAVPG
ncbi:MAG: single-stranded-DNA-specific exonuclease RecJ [Alphaproteobacteria bacterium]|nr:single-stranded-DNA-specific exonuclease RecJ [Alphaproteobacteria bacterium]